MILAGDIGGTNARLALFNLDEGQFSLVSASIFPSREYTGLDEIVSKFVASSDVRPDFACFGIAGPVQNGRVETSNLPWIIESRHLAAGLNIKTAVLINDVEANAWGVAALLPEEIVSLNKTKGTGLGNRAIIAAGTGLGEAGMYWDGQQHHVFACEGGHADFAPRNDLEVDLFRYLGVRFGHVSWERIVSGPGLMNIFNFLRDSGRGTEPEWLRDDMFSSDPAAAISNAAIEGRCGLCEQALDLFVSVYAAEAGNLALKVMATGGVYIGGGIAPKILPKLAEPAFMQAFIGKGRMQPLLESMPVHVIINDNIALLGAARRAAQEVA